MRIVHVVLGKANPDRANGINRVVHGLATAQSNAGPDVEVWGLTPTPNAPTFARRYRLRAFRAARVRWRLEPELARALDLVDAASVFHLHGGYHPEFHALARRLARRGIAWVFTPHGSLHPRVVGRWFSEKRLYAAWFDSLLLAEARAVQVFAPAEIPDVLRFAPGANVVCLPNGIDAAEFAGEPERSRTREIPVFGFCGRLDADAKGLDLLIDAFALHRSRGGLGKLVLIGDGQDQKRLSKRARRLAIDRDVEFAPPVFGAEQRARLAQLDVFVHPSRNEGMPTAVLDAAASGLPCVLTVDTHLTEAFSEVDSCWILRRHSADALAQILAKCERAWRRGETSAMGSRARAAAIARFDWAPIAKRSLDELYRAGSLSPRIARTA